MNLSRIRFCGDAFNLGSLTTQLRDPYRLHKLIWQFFSGASRSFLFARPSDRALEFYALSELPPSAPDDRWDVETKLFKPKLAAGDLLTFSVRLNPTMRNSRSAKRQRHDVVMHQKHLLKKRGERVPPLSALAQDAVSRWLLDRQDGLGVVFAKTGGKPAMLVSNYQQQRFRRKSAQVTLSTADVTGTLRVADPERFVDSVVKGIGPAKSFGCGLMLLRRA